MSAEGGGAGSAGCSRQENAGRRHFKRSAHEQDGSRSSSGRGSGEHERGLGSSAEGGSRRLEGPGSEPSGPARGRGGSLSREQRKARLLDAFRDIEKAYLEMKARAAEFEEEGSPRRRHAAS